MYYLFGIVEKPTTYESQTTSQQPTCHQPSTNQQPSTSRQPTSLRTTSQQTSMSQQQTTSQRRLTSSKLQLTILPTLTYNEFINNINNNVLTRYDISAAKEAYDYISNMKDNINTIEDSMNDYSIDVLILAAKLTRILNDDNLAITNILEQALFMIDSSRVSQNTIDTFNNVYDGAEAATKSDQLGSATKLASAAYSATLATSVATTITAQASYDAVIKVWTDTANLENCFIYTGGVINLSVAELLKDSGIFST